MSDLKLVNAILDRIREDDQLDSWSSNYTGFINVCPMEDWTVEETEAFTRMLENDSIALEDALATRDLRLQIFSEGEAIFELVTSFNRQEDQGRSPKQIDYSEKVVMGSLTVMVVIVAAFLAYTLINA